MDGSCTAAQNIFLGQQPPYGLGLGDLNNDGVLDLISASPSVTNFVPNGVALNASGLFGPLVEVDASNSASFYAFLTATADFNGDQQTDVVWADQRGNLLVALGPYDSSTSPPQFPAALSQYVCVKCNGNPMKLVVADFDGDGDLDVGMAVGDNGQT